MSDKKCEHCGEELEPDEQFMGLCDSCLEDVANEDQSWGSHEH